MLVFAGGIGENAPTLRARICDGLGFIRNELEDKRNAVMAAGSALTQDEMLRLVASAEQSFEHPLAQAIVDKAKAQNLKLEETSGFEAIPGQGMKAPSRARLCSWAIAS